MRFYQFVLRNVFRRRMRSALTITGVAVALGAVVSLVGISDGFKQSFLGMYQQHDVDLIVSDPTVLNPLMGVMPEEMDAKIRGMDGVAGVAAGLVEMISDEDKGLYGIIGQGWAPHSFMFEEMRRKIVDPPQLAEKDQPGTDGAPHESLAELLKSKKGVLLEQTLANAMHKKAGDTVVLFDHYTFPVIAIYQTDSSFEKNNIIMMLDQLQKLEGKQGKITGCTVRLKPEVRTDEARRKEICRKIEHDFAAEFNRKGKIQAKPPSEYSLMLLKLATGMAWITSAVAVIIGAIGMFNTMVMSVFERTREIGILRAIGWRPGRIMRMILMESVILSLAGGLLGTVGAVTLTYCLSRLPSTNMIGSTTSLTVIAEGFAIALVVGLLGAAYPAYRGARLMPTEAIRHE